MANDEQARRAILQRAAGGLVPHVVRTVAGGKRHQGRGDREREKAVERGFDLGAKILAILFRRHGQRRDETRAALERDPRDELIGAFGERRHHDQWRVVVRIEIIRSDAPENLSHFIFEPARVLRPEIPMPRHADNDRQPALQTGDNPSETAHRWAFAHAGRSKSACVICRFAATWPY